MEIFSSKTNALLERVAARDLYDFNNMIDYNLFAKSQETKFKKMIIFYISISQNKIEIYFDRIKRELLPVIKKKEHFDLEDKNLRRKVVKLLFSF